MVPGAVMVMGGVVVVGAIEMVVMVATIYCAPDEG